MQIILKSDGEDIIHFVGLVQDDKKVDEVLKFYTKELHCYESLFILPLTAFHLVMSNVSRL